MHSASKCQLKVKSITCYYFCSMSFLSAAAAVLLHILLLLLLFNHSCDIIVIYCCTYDDDGVVILHGTGHMHTNYEFFMAKIMAIDNKEEVRYYTHSLIVWNQPHIHWIFQRIVQFHVVHNRQLFWWQSHCTLKRNKKLTPKTIIKFWDVNRIGPPHWSIHFFKYK